jgi:predicted membrane metal-binding protein
MRASRQGSAMGLAVSIYQIAIAMGSICLVIKKKPLWYLSLLLGALATVQMIYAFYS